MPPRKTTTRKPPLRRAATTKKPDTNPWFVSTILLAGVIIGYMASSFSPGTFSDIFSKGEYPLTLPEAGKYADLEQGETEGGDYYLGSLDAPIILTEYSDFQCPFCERFFSAVMPQIEKNYIQTGQARLIYRDFPLNFHTEATLAAESAKCAGKQGAFWLYHDTLFLNQALWSGSPQAREIFTDMALQLGLKKQKFTACLDNHDMKTAIEAGISSGATSGVQGTPTTFVNGNPIIGAQPYPAFDQAIQNALTPESGNPAIKDEADSTQ